MRYLFLLVLLLALPGMTAAYSRSSGADLRVSLVLLPEAKLVVQRHASADQGQDAASIQVGDPVSIRVRLWNEGDAASEPTVRLDPRVAPMRIVVKQPDGSVSEVPWGQRGVASRAKAFPRPIQPGEEYILETYLFEHQVADASTGRITLEYLFERPGRYEIHVEYWAGDPVEHRSFLNGQRADRPPVLLSVPVVIDVAEPAIQGWKQLKDADILHYAGTSRWPALVDSTSPINATIDVADRPWLNEWRDQLLAPAPGE